GGHDYYRLRPRVHVSYHVDELPSAWSTVSSSAEPLSSVYLEKQSLRLQVPVPDAPFNLVYVSTRSIGYHTVLDIELTGDSIPDNLAEVLCHVSIGGSMFRRRFEANTNLTYTFQWDRMDMFGRPYTGLVEARVSVGYKYANCPDIVWDFTSALMSGIELVPSRLGQWSLNIVHAYDFVKGVIHRGDGGTEYLSQRPWTISTEAGNGAKRPPNCGAECRLSASLTSSSDGVELTAARLLSPVALAVTNAGHLVIGDGRFIRVADWPANAVPGERRSRLRTLYEQPIELDATVYHLANDITQRSGRAAVFISDPFRRQIYQLRFGERDSVEHQLIAGSGDACHGDTMLSCGDGGPARAAKLIEPKGLAIDRRGVLYFADGPNIRRLVPNGDSSIDDRATVETVVGQGNSVIDYSPWPCYRMVTARAIKLRWPSALTYNPVDDSVYFLDDQSVLRLTPDGFVHVVAGRPPHCPPPPDSTVRPIAAFEEKLLEPSSIAFSHRGELYITETMVAGSTPRVRVMRSDGRLHLFAGQEASPEEPLAGDVLLGPASRARFRSLGALAISPFGEVFLADREAARVHRVHQQLPLLSESRTYQVMSADATELFTFNSDGKHVLTEDTATGVVKFNFSHSSFDNNLGAAVLAIHVGSRKFDFNHSRSACEIINPNGRRLQLTYDENFGYVKTIKDLQGRLNLSATYDRFYTRFGDSVEAKSRGYLIGLATGDGRVWQFEYNQLDSSTAPSGDGSTEALGHLTAMTSPDGRRRVLRRRILREKGGTSISFDLSDLGRVASLVSTPNRGQITTRVQWFPRLGYSLQLSTRRLVSVSLNGSGPVRAWHNASWSRMALPAQYRSVIDANVALMGHHPGLTTRGDLEVVQHGSSSPMPGLHQKVFKINNQPILLISYRVSDRTESYHIINRRSAAATFDLLFSIAYSSTGLPLTVTPNPLVCLYRSVRFDYS
uniref:Tox-GHH domain-containing protein n=1 Tax=Macrostomum lignano TaxID=282301 RepID=A0A1I8GZX1_9PLAT